MINLGLFRAPAWHVGCLVAVVAALAAIPLWGEAYVWSLMCLTLMWVGLAVSWNIISGYTGYVSLGHTAFFGMGAYVGSLISVDLGVPWGLAAIAAGVVTAAVAVPIGFVLLRLRGPFFAIGMLGLSEVFRVAANKLSRWTGGGAGLYLESGERIWLVYFGFLATALAAFLVTWVISARPYGRVLRAIRDDEEAAEVLGKRTTANKVTAFVISAFFPGVLGTVYAIFLSYIDPESAFTVEYNLVIVLMAVLGGAGTVLGPVIGAAVIGAMRETFWISFPQLHLIVFGLAVVVLVLVWPDGVYPPLTRLVTRLVTPLATRLRRRTPDSTAATATEPPDVAAEGGPDIDLSRLSGLTDLSAAGARPGPDPSDGKRPPAPMLRVESLARSFAGRRVIDGCTFEVERGSVTGLIGPNGSGKTTVLNLVNGVLAPHAGRVLVGGVRVDGRRPHAVAAAGVGRTFQVPRLFDRMSVLDNMLVASPPDLDAERVRERVTASLRLVGLLGLEDRPAGKLSYGQRKLLEIARVLVTGPRLILMDEPFAGVNPVLREKIADLVQALRDHGPTFVIIGHEMTEMMALCERMIVLDQGAVLAEGSPQEIQEDERVFEAYFGASFGQGRGFVPGSRP